MDTTFWTFSVTVYQRPGVAEECLSLQERFSIDVNLLLLSAYAGSAFGSVLSVEDIADANAVVRQWHDEVVGKIRQWRRLLKPLGVRADWPHASAVEQLRARVKEIELEAERAEQAMLAEWCAARIGGWARCERPAAVAANIEFTLAHYGAANRAELPRHLIEAAVATADPNDARSG